MKNKLRIYGKRWFSPNYGHTFFSAQAVLNDEIVARIDEGMGYGSYYSQAITDLLEEKGYMPDREHHKNGSKQSPWHYFRDERGYDYEDSVVDVARKRDLSF